MSPLKTCVTAAGTLLVVGAVGCGQSGTTTAPSSSVAEADAASPAAGGSGGSGNSSSSGRLAIHLTDSPFSEAKALLITFSEVSVHRADPGAWITLPFTAGSSRTCDLKQLNGRTDVLGVGPLATGKYTQIRLTVTDARLYFDNVATSGPCAAAIAEPPGAKATVTIPSGEVKLNNEFTLTAAGTTILLDFDGDQSVHQTGSGNGNGNGNGKSNGNSSTKYMMSPVIRVVSVQ